MTDDIYSLLSLDRSFCSLSLLKHSRLIESSMTYVQKCEIHYSPTPPAIYLQSNQSLQLIYLSSRFDFPYSDLIENVINILFFF